MYPEVIVLRYPIRAVTVGATAMLFMTAFVSLAAAEPATTVSYPAGATATRYSGLAFDTCTAPSLAAITAWGASPYRAIGVYIGGVNRTCSQPQLTAGWVAAVSSLRWRLLPVYKGLQPSCGGKLTDQKIVPSEAASEGTAAADDAAANATALGMRRGSAFYNDIENYTRTDTACGTAVLRYLSAWTKELHRLGYVAGVYANLSSGALDLSDTYTSTSYARPDALWIARYDGNPSLSGWPGVSDSKWAVHQRAKQYRGDHNETYGGVAINIDNDNVSAPTATVACTSVWDKLSDGTYVADYYVSTPSNTGYSAPLPRCTYPYQVTASGGLKERSGPSRSYPVVGQLPNGALAWVVCQKKGSTVGTTAVWDKLRDNHWVSDYYVATPSNTTFSKPAPRC